MANYLNYNDSDAPKNNPRTLVNRCAKKVRDIYTLQEIWGLKIPRMIKVYINMRFPWSLGEYCDYLDDNETPRKMLREMEEEADPAPNNNGLVYEGVYFLEYEYYEIFKGQRYCSSCYAYMQQEFLDNSLNVRHCKISYGDNLYFSNTVLNELCSIHNICTLCKYELLFTVLKVNYPSYILGF